MRLKYILSIVLLFGLVVCNFTIHEMRYRNRAGELLTKEQKAEGYADYIRTINVRIGESESTYKMGYRLSELEKAKSQFSLLKKSVFDTIYWGQRGPGNVGGRTRSILVDPDDETHKTWYAGTAGGGIWKTEDGGDSWADLTPEMPNLSTISLAMAPSDHNIIYAGTGEGFGNVGGITGDGIFITKNRGESWGQIASTANNSNFSFVNKIWVDPIDDNILVVASNSGIFKSVNAGSDWNCVYDTKDVDISVQDLVQNPDNKSVLYAGVNSIGVLRSNNSGDSWELSNAGLLDGLRYAIDVSPVDTSIVFASVESSNSTAEYYISEDGGLSWAKHNDADGEFINFHNAQGWYNNCLVAHPEESHKVFVAGVYLGLLSFNGNMGESDPMVTATDTISTSSFFDFVNFGGAYFGGGMSTGIDEGANVDISDFLSIEIRFGNELSQMAHRFLVPEGQGAGVPYSDYEYVDYVEVPFQVWDIDNNQQLMISFRDQERDGKFNLIERDLDDPNLGREYLFISAYPYDESSPQTEIVNAQNENKGGHFEKLLYFIWPTLPLDGTWDEEALPESVLHVEFGAFALQDIFTTVLADGEKNTGLHVDHHALVVIPPDIPGQDFEMISGNDGGVGYSSNSGISWLQKDDGFITTQLYGVSKKPGVDQFFGGFQDNGSYLSPFGQPAISTSKYNARLGGDGFETLWHPDGEQVLGSIYNNRIYRSENGGLSFSYADKGIDGDGPFITKLSFNRSNPDVIFTIGAKGVYKHREFGNYSKAWELKSIDEGLVLNETASSALNVKVSLADPNIVWAGAGMFQNTLKIFVSSNNGESFTSVNSYNEVEMGYSSGMATHPTDPNTAYLIFSYANSPKIIRTTDKGQTWEDISGFGTNDESSNGFPDVAVQDLLVMPDNPDVIWVGTEIGIVESLDNGENWHLLDSEFPNVSVFRLKYQDGMVIIGTHGRGIWTAANRGVSVQEKEINVDINVFPNPASEMINVSLPEWMFGDIQMSLYDLSGREVGHEQGFVVSGTSYLQMNIQKYLPGNYILKIENEGISGTCHLVLQ